VHSTPAGLALLERVTAQVRAHDAALLAALGDEGPQLRGLLDRLAATADALATPIPPSG
jgi:DNA-binding MarR family transcriptional regulator